MANKTGGQERRLFGLTWPQARPGSLLTALHAHHECVYKKDGEPATPSIIPNTVPPAQEWQAHKACMDGARQPPAASRQHGKRIRHAGFPGGRPPQY